MGWSRPSPALVKRFAVFQGNRIRAVFGETNAVATIVFKKPIQEGRDHAHIGGSRLPALVREGRD